MQEFARDILSLAKRMQQEAPRRGRPPDRGFPAESEQVLPFSVVRGTRGYIEMVANQINGCYEHGWFDACAVMMRRLLETLIIEVFEALGIADTIKGGGGDFLPLGDLINKTLAKKSWNLSRNSQRALKSLKKLGDNSAHNRRFNAHCADIEKVQGGFRVVVQELLSLAKLT